MTLKEILADPNISYWLKEAVKTAYEQDPVDALRDARRLLKMLGERYTRIVNGDLGQRIDQSLPSKTFVGNKSKASRDGLPRVRNASRFTSSAAFSGRIR